MKKLKRKLIVLLTVAKNFILGVNLVSLFMIFRPRKMIIYITETLFFYKSFNSKRKVPQKHIFKILPSKNIESVKFGCFENGETWFDRSSLLTDILNLSLICKIHKPKTIFEIGTLRGYTTFHLALNSPDDAIIYTLDLPSNEKIIPKLKTTLVDDSHIKNHQAIEKFAFTDTNEEKKINLLMGDSAIFDYSPFYKKIDLFFIDGAHSYDYVRSDTLNALKCCHKGSIITWHDYGRSGVNGVSEYLSDLKNEYDIYSVPGGSLAYMVVK